MSRSFKCKLCGARLSVGSGNDASPLLVHIISSHPEIKIPDSVANETAQDVEEAKRKNLLHIPKNTLDQIKKSASGDDKSKGQSIENNPQTTEHKKMSSSDKASESKSQKTSDTAVKLPSKSSKTNSDKGTKDKNEDTTIKTKSSTGNVPIADSKSQKTSESPIKLPSKTSKANSDKITKDINEDESLKKKSSTTNASIADFKSRVPQDKVAFKESRSSVEKNNKVLMSKSVSGSSQDTKSDKNHANASHSSASKLQGDSKSSLNKGFNEKGHIFKSAKVENPNKEPNPQESKNSVNKMRIIKHENFKIPADNTVEEDVFHTPRSSLEFPSNSKDSKAAAKKDSKDKHDKPHTSKSKSKNSQELISSDSKNPDSKKQSTKSKNRKNSADSISSTKTEDSHRKQNDPMKLATKNQKADSMASGDETPSAKSKDGVPKRSKKSNAPVGIQAYDAKYRYSIEKWKPGNGQIVCPKCGMKQRPILRARSDKVSSSPLGAACILTCWPLCFLPCLFPPPSTEYLYCSVCNNLLGSYDRKTEVIQPVTEKTEKTSKQSPKDKNSAREVSDHAPASASVKETNATK